jgi:hypothetical protein
MPCKDREIRQFARRSRIEIGLIDISPTHSFLLEAASSAVTPAICKPSLLILWQSSANSSTNFAAVNQFSASKSSVNRRIIKNAGTIAIFKKSLEPTVTPSVERPMKRSYRKAPIT